ncbi:secretion system effector C (SseC) family protein [Paraburkholderia sp. BL8N3]|nr:type III secretion system translocon subunit SctE [Paraburkholderia sp. BL8N3]TCK31997.1 secretion system effector C (SseC) family protein [Paraburkholderia sp. BL8N3]
MKSELNPNAVTQDGIDTPNAQAYMQSGIRGATGNESDVSIAKKKTHLHVASELSVSLSAVERDSPRGAADFVLMPDTPVTAATQAQARGALTNILTKLNVESAVVVGGMVVDSDSQIPMSVIMYAVGVVSLQSLSNTVRLVGKALEIQTDRQTKAVLKRLDDYREQLRKQQEEMEQARKSNIFTMAFDWVIGATEVVAGISTLVIGDVPGGALEIYAGVLGLAKATLETVALFDEDDAKELLDVAGEIGIAQMILECVSMLAGAGPYGVALRLALQSGMQVGNAVIDLQKTDAQKGAASAGVQMDAQQYIIDATEKSRKQTVEFLRDLYSKNEAVVRGTSDMINSIMEGQLRIARSLGGSAGRYL